MATNALSNNNGRKVHTNSTLLPPPRVRKHWAKKRRTLIASSCSSVLSTCLSFPLDSVKTRLQAYGYRSVNECVVHTYNSEGIKGFWRGCLAPLFSITLVRTISFTIYQKAKYVYSDAIGRATGQPEPLVVVNQVGSTPTLTTIACFGLAGSTAGSMVTFIACPFELTKVSAQLSTLMINSKRSSMDEATLRKTQIQSGTIRTARNIIRSRGFLGLYSGFSYHLTRDTIGTFIYFATYESTKQLLVKFSKSDSPTSPSAVAAAGGLCGILSWICVYPIDTAKTHYQRNCLSKGKGKPVPTTKIQFLSRNMYKGLGVSMARSCLINAIFFSSFEQIKKRINALPDPVQ